MQNQPPANSILATLNQIYDLGPTVAIRQESGLNPAQVGELNLEKLDQYVARRVAFRAQLLTGILSGVVMPAYVWPFAPPQLVSAYPAQTPDQRDNTLAFQLTAAAEIVVAGVLGDLFNRATPRDDKYKDQRDHYLGDPDDPADTGEAGRMLRELKLILEGAQQPNDDPADSFGRTFVTSLRGEGDTERSQYCPTRPRSERENRCL